MNAIKLADNARWPEALKKLTEGKKCYGPVVREGRRVLAECKPAEAVLEGARTVDPIKTLLVPVRDEVAKYPRSADAEPSSEQRVLLGARQCDIAALRELDYSYLQAAAEDPFYKARRQNTLIIGADCTEPYEVCHCTHYGSGPHVSSGADIAVSRTRSGWLIEALTEFGEREVNVLGLPDAPQAAIDERTKNREGVRQKLEAKVQGMGLPRAELLQELVIDERKEGVWDKFGDNCVECGACNFICCTCHCFLLVDARDGESCTRTKNWDSCLFKNFARVAGGANPRKWRSERLRNRFLKKFDFFKTHIGKYACDGCGRCIEACAGKIDIREVLRELVNG